MPQQRFVFALAAVTALCAGAACSSKPTASASAVSPDTWAAVDGHNISRGDVDKAYRRVQDASQQLSEDETLTAKLNLLNDLITQEILVGKAAALKIDVSAADLDAAFAETKKNIPDEAFQQELTRRGMTATELRDGLRRELLARKVVENQVTSKVTVTDKELNDFYNANRVSFNVAEESYHIAQIVITPTREAQPPNRTGDDAATPQAAAAKTKMLMERLQAGAPFQELAADYSEDPNSAPRGGDLGLVPVSALRQAPPQLRDAVLNKPAGSVSVATAGDAHTIVAVISHESAGQRDLTTPGVRDRITQTLRGRKEQLLRAAYLAAIRNDAKVENYLARKLVESQGKLPGLPLASPGAR